jgi:GT2 family glycosyltransferase
VNENLKLIQNQDGKYSGDCSRDFLLHPSQAIVLLGASTALIRKEIVTHIGGFDETLSGPGEDWDFFRRISQNTSIDFIDQYLVLYRQHGNSASRVSAEHYFEGNRRAVRNMYRQSGHNFLERRYSWVVLHWSFFKTELKSKRFNPAMRQLAKAVSPIGR